MLQLFQLNQIIIDQFAVNITSLKNDSCKFHVSFAILILQIPFLHSFFIENYCAQYNYFHSFTTVPFNRRCFAFNVRKHLSSIWSRANELNGEEWKIDTKRTFYTLNGQHFVIKANFAERNVITTYVELFKE